MEYTERNYSGLLALNDALIYKGAIDCSANPNYPAADAGHVYVVSVAGKIGGASGTVVVAGDVAICNTDGTAAGNQATVGSYWNVFETNIDLSNVTITGGTITGITDLVVADGGTGASTLTDHGVLVGSGTDAVTALTVGTNGQVLVGSTGADPVFATITDGEGIDTTLGAGTLTIACETASDTNPGVIEIATDAEFAAGTDTSRAVTAANVFSMYGYETIFIPASAMTPTATNGATAGTTEYATNDINIDYLSFDGATEQYAEFQCPMPENWDRSTIKAKFFWTSATGSTAGDTVEWEIAAGALSDNDAIDAALGTGQVISDALLADNGGDMQLSGATPALTVGGTPALADMVHFKVSRNVGGTDDMTEAAWLFGAWIQYKITNTVAAW